MAHTQIQLDQSHPKVVGSFGSSADLRESSALTTWECCDIAEIRLDILMSENAEIDATRWQHLSVIPLLFTARRIEEGGACPLDAGQRMDLLRLALDQAALVDIEVASIGEMGDLLNELAAREIPWIGSFHDFDQLPDTSMLDKAAQRAKEAGAAMFKTAAMLSQPADLARLAEFQLADHGIPVSTMGMGPLAAVSRLLCAQCGSLLNYGYIGNSPTAPGQWDSRLLKQGISRLASIKG
ncbi:MAG: type I 3-dehydroquinate dehydratase [Luteolibacter sp.]